MFDQPRYHTILVPLILLDERVSMYPPILPGTHSSIINTLVFEKFPVNSPMTGAFIKVNVCLRNLVRGPTMISGEMFHCKFEALNFPLTKCLHVFFLSFFFKEIGILQYALLIHRVLYREEFSRSFFLLLGIAFIHCKTRSFNTFSSHFSSSRLYPFLYLHFSPQGSYTIPLSGTIKS